MKKLEISPIFAVNSIENEFFDKTFMVYSFLSLYQQSGALNTDIVENEENNIFFFNFNVFP